MNIAVIIAIAAGALLGLAVIVWLTERALVAEKPAGRHARVPFADPRDVTDPDATVWLKAIRRDPGATLTAPPRETHHGPPPLADLARVRDALLALDVPPAPEAALVLTAPVPVQQEAAAESGPEPEIAPGAEHEPVPDWLTTSAIDAFAPVLELGDVRKYVDRVFAPAEEAMRAVVAEHLGSDEGHADFAGVSVAGLRDWDLSPVPLNGDAGRHSGGSGAVA